MLRLRHRPRTAAASCSADGGSWRCCSARSPSRWRRRTFSSFPRRCRGPWRV